MALSIDTLRALMAVDPFKRSPATIVPRDDYLGRLDDAGLLPYMARQNMTGPSKDNHLWYYQSKDGHEYLRADIYDRTDSTKITEIAIKRVAKVDQVFADECRHVHAEQGGAAVFQLMATAVRRHDLEQLATPRTLELASPDEALARRNHGRSM